MPSYSVQHSAKRMAGVYTYRSVFRRKNMDVRVGGLNHIKKYFMLWAAALTTILHWKERHLFFYAILEAKKQLLVHLKLMNVRHTLRINQKKKKIAICKEGQRNISFSDSVRSDTVYVWNPLLGFEVQLWKLAWCYGRK